MKRNLLDARALWRRAWPRLRAMLVAAAAFSVMSADGASMLTYRTSWVGNTYGGAPAAGVQHQYVQIAIEAIAAGADGTVYTNTPWDEGGGELGVWRDGHVTYAMQSHGWGNSGGDAIAVNSHYIYASASIDNEGGGLVGRGDYPEKGMHWAGITRRKVDDPTVGIPFSGGRGNLNSKVEHAFLLVDEVPDKVDASIRGVAVDEHTLFVADQHENAIKTYDAMTLQPGATWQAERPGALAVAPDGSLWAIVAIQTPQVRLQHYAATGTPLHDAVPLPQDAVPVSIALDSKGRLLVADDGPRQQVLIYAHGENGWHADGELGEEHGILGGTPGVVGPQRFNGLTSVAADSQGRIYVAMDGRGPRTLGTDNGGVGDGAVLEGYGPDGKRLFSVGGLLFVDGADVDRGDVSPDGNTLSVFTGAWHFKLDLSKTAPGSEWRAVGFTADRFKYPGDPLYHAGRSERGMPMVRRIEGKRFLFFTDMFYDYVKVYRFDPQHEGEIAIPSGLVGARAIFWPPQRPEHSEWIWRDLNGDGTVQANEIEELGKPGDASCWYVDMKGDVWEGMESAGIRHFRVDGLDHFGNPRYDFPHSSTHPLPAPFTRVARIVYEPDTDTMYLAGASAEYPWDNRYWNSTGKLIARYDHWSTTPVLRYQIPVDSWGPKAVATGGITQEGDYLFVVESTEAIVRVYEANTGAPVGEIRPGPEVGGTSGWVDVPMPITAYRRANGEYLVFVEEDAMGKVIMYRWTPGAHAPA